MPSIQTIRKILWVLVAIAALVAVIAWIRNEPPRESIVTASDTDEAPVGGAFTLTDMNGQTVTEKSWPDQYKIIFFGFTNCPDICPTGLQTVAAALDLLPAAQKDKVQPLFITVDPERDTVEEVKNYVPQFHSKIIGLTGSKEQIDNVVKQFKVYAARVPEPEGVESHGNDYMVDHSTIIYVMSPDNRFLKGFSSEMLTPEQLAEELKSLVK